MLDAATKRNLDSACDTLVGIAPTPAAQVDQITTALIYKFMDERDQRSIRLGGKPKYFAGALAQYAWSNLMSPALSGQERYDLYTTAIAAIPKAKNIPQLFREILAQSFVPPINDGGVLTQFLEQVSEFDYTNSENLGNAFEYLLLKMGAQGDAGQFRTPRHIIDFIVRVINPQKNETILDPACGTAGFLISAYKHILKQNGDALDTSEMKTLNKNITGYDISPDMVRLSLVNLHLHDFADPKIHRYDTLTNDAKWRDDYNIILANPPFMTPKGGIQPHNKFSVSANRSEVLFVDYIAEHLTPGGRAGIIVPEGIIFRAGKAYKQLRQNLVTNWGLIAVVSLPNGVFNPYSGVKTSILILDKKMAKTANKILFVTVNHVGYSLGAKVLPVSDNDLPDALAAIQQWQTKQTIATKHKHLAAHAVTQKAIAADGDYNLTGTRYQQTTTKTSKHPMVALGEVCEIKRGTTITKKETVAGDIPVIASGRTPAYYHNKANRHGNTITVAGSGDAGFVNYFKTPIFASDCMTIAPLDNEKLSTDFLFYSLKNKQDEIYKLKDGSSHKHVYAKDLAEIKIPLPPLSEQEEIVAEINGYQSVIDGAQQVITNYRPVFNAPPPPRKWRKNNNLFAYRRPLRNRDGQNMVALGEACNILGKGKRPSSFATKDGKYTFLVSSLVAKKCDEADYDKEALTVGDGGTANINYVNGPFSASNHTYILENKNTNKINLRYVYLFLFNNLNLIEAGFHGIGLKNLPKKFLQSIKIPLPPLSEQEAIVAELEAEEKAVDGCRALITRMQQKIQTKINQLYSPQ